MFLGRCLVCMADGTFKPISQMAKGDKVLCCPTLVKGGPNDKATATAEVACLLVYPRLSYSVPVQDSNLVIRFRHPIKNPKNGEWCHAWDLRANTHEYSDETGYHVLLTESAPSNTIVVSGIIAASIGAYLKEGIRLHDYTSWFSEYDSVAADMAEVDLEGWEKGRVEVTGIKRSGDDDGSTCGFRTESYPY